MRTTRTTRIAAVAAGVAGLALVAGAAAAAAWNGGVQGMTTSMVGSAAVSTAEDSSSALVFNREEERMARDLYRLFADRYDSALFARIASSEQQHFAAVGRLLTAYGVDDPAAGRAAGDYADPRIEQLYDDWREQGLISLDKAYDVGVALEKRDIADLEAAVKAADQADVKTMLSRLLAASRMHLRAFTAAADGATGWGGGGMGWGMGGGRGPGTGMGPGAGMGPGTGMGRGWAHGPGDCPMR